LVLLHAIITGSSGSDPKGNLPIRQVHDSIIAGVGAAARHYNWQWVLDSVPDVAYTKQSQRLST